MTYHIWTKWLPTGFVGLTILAILFASNLEAQTPLELSPCGTPVTKDDWRKSYLSNKVKYRTPDGEILRIPLKIHLVANDDGKGFYSYLHLMRALCSLNNDFAASQIEFYIYDDIDYIYNSAWNQHESILEGADMMFANNDPKAINCYITSSAAGNCGYNLPYAGVVLSKGCLTGHTWAHEIGHNLSLPHPFLGWEGKQYDYNTPTPKKVTYDYTLFKDSLILDTTIIDTAAVELLDGSNCTVAADQICDSPPDYLSYRWRCDANGKSTVLQKDYNGQEFYSDGTLIMSYSNSECQTRFTPDEIELMLATIMHKKAFLLDAVPPDVYTVDDVSQLDYPTQGEDVPLDNVQLSWQGTPHATKYVVQVSLNKSFSRIKHQAETDTNYYQFSLKTARKHYWRVFSFGTTDYCSERSPTGFFNAINPVGTHSPYSQNASFAIYHSGNTPLLFIDAKKDLELTIFQYSILGALSTVPLETTVHKGSNYIPLVTEKIAIVVVVDNNKRIIYKRIFKNK